MLVMEAAAGGLSAPKSKKCRSCGKRKCIAKGFYKNPSAKSGYSSSCRTCRKVQIRAAVKVDPAARDNYLRLYRAAPRGRAVSMFNQKRAYCRQYGVPFDLTVDWILGKIEKGVCELTGIAFSCLSRRVGEARDPHQFSIDRIDATQGYVASNCRAVILAVNIAKQEWPDAVLRQWATALCSMGVT